MTITMKPTALEPAEEHATKLIREGLWAAEVDVTLLHTGHEWSPYLAPADVRRLDAVRAALRAGDIEAAKQLGRVYELKPVAAE
jgi:hypothetical protein